MTTTVYSYVSNPPEPLPSSPLAEMELELITCDKCFLDTVMVGSQAASQVRSCAPEETQEQLSHPFSHYVPSCLLWSQGLPTSLFLLVLAPPQMTLSLGTLTTGDAVSK